MKEKAIVSLRSRVEVAEKSITASTMTFLGLQKAQGLSGSSWSCQQIGHLDSGSLKKEEFFKRSQTAYV